MGFKRGLTALLLLTVVTITASGAENLMRTVRYNYTQAMRVVDDLTMTHRYLAPDEWGEPVVVDEVSEWILDNKWRRERVWMNPYGDRTVHSGYETGGTKSTVIFDGRQTWVEHVNDHGSRLLSYGDALRDDPRMEKIDYNPPEEPFMRYLPDYGYEISRDELFGHPCIVAECGYDTKNLIPQDGDVRIHTAWIDRDDKTVLRLRGFYYWRDRVYTTNPTNHSLLDSAEIQIDNTTFETVTLGYLTSVLPKETIVTIDGVDDQYTAYWYNTHLPASMFWVDRTRTVVVADTGPIYIPIPPPPHCRRCPAPPHPPRPHPPHPGPPSDEPEKRPPHRPRPGGTVVEDQNPNTIQIPKPYPKPKPSPKQEPSPTYPTSDVRRTVVESPSSSSSTSTSTSTYKQPPPSKPNSSKISKQSPSSSNSKQISKPRPKPKPKPVKPSKTNSKNAK